MEQPLTRAELAASAEQAWRRTFPHLARHRKAAISERTIRYWTREGLLPPRGGPNRLGLYEPELVLRCVFIRRLGHEHALGLSGIRAVLARVDADTVARVATGGELPPAVAADAAAAGAEAAGEQAAAGDAGGARPVFADGSDSPGPDAVAAPPVAAAPQAGPSSPIEAEPAYPQAPDDSPARLQSLSDHDRAAAVNAALKATTGRSFDVILFAVEYTVSGHRGPFRAPACIDCEISPDATSGDRESAIERLQQIPDDRLCTAIADELSALTGEPYRAEVLVKRYARPLTLPDRRLPARLRLAILLAAAVEP